MRLFCRQIGARILVPAALAIALMLSSAVKSQAQVAIGVSVNIAPPELPVYEQPPCPGEGYLWTPGYWAWDSDYGDYYWVPGTWVLAPQPGYLWTPPYWGWSGVAFVFHEGYWGPRVGFYGGINYGYGYSGRGYEGGRWDRDRFYYNRSVNNVNVTQIHNVYNTTVVNNVNVTRVSYNGGNGGVTERPTQQEQQAERERHVPAVAAQQQHFEEARKDRALRASDNHGKPPIAATDKPAQFRGGAVVPAKAGNYTPPPNRGPNSPNRPGVNTAPKANKPAPAPAPNATRPPENRSDRPPNANRPAPNANKPAPTPNAPPKANRPAPNAPPNSRPPENRNERPPNANRPASNASPKPNSNRSEANRPAPNANPPRTAPPSTAPQPNEKRQQEQRQAQQKKEQPHQPQAEPRQQKPQQKPQPKQQPPPKQEQRPDNGRPPY